MPYDTTDVADSLVVQVTVAVVPDPVAATAVSAGGVVSGVAKVRRCRWSAGDVLELPALSAEVTR